MLTLGALVASACTNEIDAEPAPSSSTVPVTVTTEPSAYYAASIRRTEGGVPHIIADDLRGVFFGQGYASAQDHGCSLADQLLRVQGRRSEFFGPGDDDAYLNSDFAWRAIGIDQIARADYLEADEELTEQFEAFAAGWNDYLEDDGFTGWCKGADWVQPITGEDVYAYARSVALTASSAQLVRYIATAQPPAADDADTSTTTDDTASAAAPDFDVVTAPPVASNGWAIGSDRTTGGIGGLLLANPHFPWEGEFRFWEVHLTVPGELDIYGAQLLGLPGVGIGFTQNFAWTHTVSAGTRFTAYTLTLDPDDPTSYLVDGESVPMTSEPVSIDVQQSDGSTTTVERTMWRSEYGPILDFPGVGWSDSLVLTYRDANIDNDEFLEQYAAMDRAKSLDEFVNAHRVHQGVPLFNTIAVGADGRAWYADTSATPNLSDEAEAEYLASLEQGGFAAIAAESRVVLLDGSDSRFRWEEVDGARDPGLVPFDEMPATERTDHVFNANDSYWLSNAEQVLAGDFSVLHGAAGVEQSWRTRQNAVVLSDSDDGAAGADGTFTADELRTLAFDNEGFVAARLLEPVVERCVDAGFVRVPELTADNGDVVLAAESIGIGPACEVLAAWDGRYDLDSRGAALWREFIVQTDIDALWAEPFDPDDPVGTPSGLVAAPAPDPASILSNDPVLIGLARAVQVLTKAGYPIDAPLGDLQYTERSGQRIPLHGGFGSDGVTNILSWSGANNTTESLPGRGDTVVPGSSLTPTGYPINYGSSFIMVVDFSTGAPQAWTILVYGETGDRTSSLFELQTLMYSQKQWKQVLFAQQAIYESPDLSVLEVSGEQA